MLVVTTKNNTDTQINMLWGTTTKSPHKMQCEQDIQPTCEFCVLSCVLVVVCFVYMTCCAFCVVSYQHACGHNEKQYEHANQYATKTPHRMQCEQPTCEFGVLSCVFVVRFVYMTCYTFAVVSFIFVTHANVQHTTTKRDCPHQMHDARRPLSSYQRDESFRISQFFHEIHPGGTINSVNAS